MSSGAKRGLSQDSDDGPHPEPVKRLKTWGESNGDGQKRRHADYTVGWICALHIELAASRAMLDRQHRDLLKIANDPNEYVLGNIGAHNVVMACLPSGQYGTNNAAIVASNMRSSFPSIRVGFMVGIGGGVPSDGFDIRLGDVVVGTTVIQYDLGKILSGERVQRTGIPRVAPHDLLNAVSKLRALHESMPSEVPSVLRHMLHRHPKMARKYAYPSQYEDRLFYATYDHEHPADCNRCDPLKVQPRPLRESSNPEIHYGGVASGNQVVKDGRTRNRLAKELGVICFEMEAAGMVDQFPCMTVRGICDYADSHKNKQWQRYAAATAAAYAKELLSTMAPSRIEAMPTVDAPETTPDDMQQELQARRADLLGLLRFEQLDSRHTSIKAAHRKTCEWLLKHEAYKDWLDPSKLPQHHGFLWISGKPGAGKSTLMKFVFGRTKKSLLAGKATASFFFHARGDELEKTIFGLYRSLLLQLLESFPDLQAVLDDLSLIPLNQTVCPTVEILKRLFRGAILSLGQRSLTCFVDALDECSEGQVEDMVRYFEDLGEEADENQIKLRICFSSRHYPHIRVKNGLKLTVEDQLGHKDDLEKYVRSYLGEVGSENYTKKIQDQILEKADGVFIWVVLVLDILNKEIRDGRLFAIENRLRQIPSKLSELFKDILLRDNNNMDDLLLCIQWILYAKRPLRRQEFYFAVLSGLNDGSLVPYNPEQFTADVMERFVVSSSKGLAETTKTKVETVQFIHESVRDFLIKDHGLQELWPTLGEDFQGFSHDKLQQCCLRQITLDMSTEIPTAESLPRANSQEGRRLRQTAAEKFPFLGYAIEHVLHHADAASGISQSDFFSHFPLSTWIRLNNVFEKHEIRRYTPEADITYILSDRNFANLLEASIQRHQDAFMPPRAERYGLPLFAALANGNQQAAEVLLGQGQDLCDRAGILRYLNCRKLFESPKVRTPLQWAAEKGHGCIFSFLIGTKLFDLTTRDSKGRTVLHLAAMGGDKTIVRTLLEEGLDVDVPCAADRTPLLYAAEHGQDSAALLLIEKGALLESRNSLGWTPLFYAAMMGGESVVRVLIGEGANVNTASDSLMTPIYVAAAQGRETVVKILYDSGASIDQEEKDGETPLHRAALNGELAVVKFLFKHGASLDCRNKRGLTLLQHVYANGHTDVVEFLYKNSSAEAREEFDREREGTDGPNITVVPSMPEIDSREAIAAELRSQEIVLKTPKEVESIGLERWSPMLPAFDHSEDSN
ncbi:NACHT and ankyrin domain protein [Colletotrichum tofieldiae]|uniref:NACHT and ankyrin domain protein n=1 Tax=Colletotrichum tofieldiae TaxID=708197 RepID=A0A166YY06_9PEZI|nr:NACHT and ankyrin domain protein [Colletotrichum tofieldiae]